MRQTGPRIGAAADIFEFYAGYCSKLYGEAMVLANGSIINLLKEPVGVVDVITPWKLPAHADRARGRARTRGWLHDGR